MKLFSKFILLIAFLATASMTVTAGYRVQSGRIYDNRTNQEILLRGVNWFGFQEQNDYVVHGLWARNWRSQIKQMKNIGVNAVRLPFCPSVLQNVPVTNKFAFDPNLNRELKYKKSLELFDLVINELNNEQMYILLDHHTPDCKTLTETWYTETYTEQQWLDDLAFVAERYKNLPYVIGIDLKNEPHGVATWGTGLQTDWKLAAETAATRVLSVAPEMLIFVEGIEDNNQPYVPPCSTGGHWWGGNFEPMDCYPLNIPADRLVLSPHVYGPDVSVHTYFNHPDFPNNMPYWWDLHFGHFAPQHAIVFGEFGGRYGHSSPNRVADPRDIPWQNKIVDYMIEKNMRSSFYWSWNPNSLDTGGILQDDWTNVWDDKVALLQRLWGYTPQTPEHGCSDGRDADGDGLLDYPADPGCQNAEDDDEFNPPITGQGLEVTTVSTND
jgi:endoglucanase